MKRQLLSLAFTFAFVGLLATLGSAFNPFAKLTPAVPAVHAQGNPFPGARSWECSLGTLRGAYGFSYDGFVMGSAIAALGPITFDGTGGLAGKYTSNVGGRPFQGAFTGTYTVGTDCSGTGVINFPVLGFTINGTFVLVNGGKEAVFTSTDTGITINGSAQKQDPK